jgi:hypothetical protein
MSVGEVAGLGSEALEAYVYGERRRFDSHGRRWEFVREARADNQFWLTITVSIEGFILDTAGMTLDRIAGKIGEEALVALVERMSETVTTVHNAAVAQQRALQAEA